MSKYVISIPIPICDDRPIDKTIYSILPQDIKKLEILILRNGSRTKRKEATILSSNNISIKQIFIEKKSKSLAINTGIEKANSDLICILDADCRLEENALKIALEHFKDEKVMAVGGKLIAIAQDNNFLYRLQSLEYKKVFNLIRPLFNKFKANFIISGAFGIFRKEALQAIGGFDIDTVGEDMELILRLQEHSKEKDWKNSLREKI